jgi:hypothetical protein
MERWKMRRATFTGNSGVNTLFYLCGLIPNEHSLYTRFVEAHSLLNAEVNHLHLPNAYRRVTFFNSLEVCDLLEWLGYYDDVSEIPEAHIQLLDTFTPIADKLHKDEARSAGRLS